jgi:hypothetical protein
MLPPRCRCRCAAAAAAAAKLLPLPPNDITFYAYQPNDMAINAYQVWKTIEIGFSQNNLLIRVRSVRLKFWFPPKTNFSPLRFISLNFGWRVFVGPTHIYQNMLDFGKSKSHLPGGTW